ncbi:hypothetical protein L1987_85553 [Smallanthus sonchifolius]|uniref:Uncharacterized protein n=1 Tax=Smallanthus sonchifolius TaxID=185202 RepID=A0ACB8XWS9_9ASTR|nr:hypothetical protein L1987_85553 [Smallanthus sonchifolius]
MGHSSYSSSKACAIALTISCLIVVACGGSFYDEMDITFGGERAKISNGGQDLSLSLDQYSGSGFQSKHEYLFGRFDMQLKLVPGNSAGTVTTFYTLSSWATPRAALTQSTPTSTRKGKEIKNNNFTYGLTPLPPSTRTLSYGTHRESLRVFNNHEAAGVPFPTSQPMRVYASLWNADDWATQGGRVKTDWTKAPFTAYYRKFNANADKVGPNSKSTSSVDDNQAWRTQGVDAAGRNRIRWVQNKHMIYNYCNDHKRFANGLPVECKRSRFL